MQRIAWLWLCGVVWCCKGRLLRSGKTEKSKRFDNDDMHSTCPIYEVPISDPRSNLRVVDTYKLEYTTQYSTTDINDGRVYVSCPNDKDLQVLGPDTRSTRAINKDYDKVMR